MPLNHIYSLIGILLFLPYAIRCQNVLTPPYFNLAEGRRIAASATCGEGVEEPELFCKLVGANSEKKEDNENLIIQGQVCDYCNPKDPDKKHPPENAVDGQETWWQSPPLSRGMKYNEVNLTIDLGQEFHVAYVIIKMGNSPRPGVWVLERSADNGQSFSPWQYFADTVGDCQIFFGNNISTRITNDDSIICDTQFSKIVPLEGGEIIVQLVQNRPSANDFFNSVLLQEWTRATNVRFRFLRVKNLLGHLMSVARQDPTTTRRYFYSVKDISIGGRCRCNGHAEVCDLPNPSDSYKLICNCQHNTCGHNCEICCPGFEQKKWSQSKNNKRFVCERCNCFDHSDQCVYNETVDSLRLSLDIHGKYDGGGVCQNCQHNTEGINCDRCISGYYKPFEKSLNATDVCQPCNCNYHYATGNCYEGTGKCECKPEYTKPNCDSCSLGYYGYPNCRPCECFLNGTRSFQCEAGGGQCPCKPNFGGKYCKQCSEGYYKHPQCKPCDCNSVGSTSNVCNINSGECKCKSNYGGRSCDECTSGYYSFPSCTFCNCEVKGTTSDICDKTSGKCLCKPGYGGPRCDQCLPDYTGFPDCKPCNCSTTGSAFTSCDVIGKCHCLANYGGKTCDQCSPGYYKYPDCFSCNCSIYGTLGVSCDNDGRCRCKANFDGIHCEKCREGFYNFPLCEECNFDPAGVLSTFAGCGSLVPGELITCKPRVIGKICNECKELYWNLQTRNPDGCEECQCETNGTVGRVGTCNTKSGQCICKPYTTSRRCDQCDDGFYNLSDDNLFGCTDCDCDIGGSINAICDKITGQCACQARIKGKTCREPVLTHYFPTLHQYQYEVEDGRTSGYTPVRYGFDEDVFPEYSWKGYAVFSHLQNETLHLIMISKSSIYRLIFRYINTNEHPILGTISAMPEDPNNIDTEQKFQVLFKPTRTPAFVTVAGITGNNPSPFVLNPGGWLFKISSQSGLFLDYFVIIPAEYYEADLLVYEVVTPCLTNTTGLCRHHQYPLLEKFDKVNGTDSYILTDDIKEPPKRYLNDVKHLQILNLRKVPELSLNQRELNFDVRITKRGPHVFLVNYFSKTTDDDTVTIPLIVEIGDKSQRGFLSLYPCQYTMLCRKVALNKDGRATVFNLDTDYVKATLKNDESETIFGIESIAAIPYNEWHLDYIQPKPSCIRKDGVCMPSTYLTPPDSKRIDFKTGSEYRISKTLPSTIYDNTTELIYLDKDDTLLDASGKVPKSGPYVFVVHYYQPNFPEFEMNVLIHNGQTFEGKLPVQHCPSNSGCRAIVQQKDGNNKIVYLTENVFLSLTVPDRRSIWLHYVLIIPKNAYSEDIVDEQPFDQTALFLSECGKNSFRLNVSESGFCRDATYSLTTKYNSGALPCACDFDGTLDLQCNPYGGQCPCRENVIGRRCDYCKTGYFGFPHCKSCDCPSTAYCEPVTGECVCPQNVQGERCNQCIPYTFGYHAIIGCEDCNCNIAGVKNDNLQCDLSDGSCDCKQNIEGRTCDRCRAGHWSFPQCFPCDCDLRGTTEEICNKSSSGCYCKSNVQGVACDICKDGTFNLQPVNEDGCTKCFCFGKTKRCFSSALFRAEINEPKNWKLAVVNVSKTVEISPLALTPEVNSHEIFVDMTLVLQSFTYFVAPEIYLGNKLTAYAGFLNYTILYVASDGGTPISGADVILYGSNIYLFYSSVEQPVDSESYFTSLQIIESNFVTISNSPATREQLMQVLQNLTGLYIRAAYWDQTVSIRIIGVRFEIAVSEYSEFANLALSVEQCQCPPNYVGLSCEECADGYFRASTGPFGGFCIACQCNGHASSCDKTTGVCYNCKHNTVGDHCEMCEVGYYGNATYGTTNDCLICACPLPITSNNFATSCNINEQGDKIDCECAAGYIGSRCERCAAGYYGRPDHLGSKCVPCECNGNIDVDDPQSCDPITGECLKCLNNTYGKGCSICAPNYFGDAIVEKNCQSCVCDKCGTKLCDHKTGHCTCHDNVIGEKCDRCDDEHYGFNTCSGCSPCKCDLASESRQCDDVSGHCRCKPGVFGRTCDKCAAGFWKYSVDGCTSCGCNIGYSIGVGCNATTGSCQCLPGVDGDKCDTCPYRWVLIPNEGCFKCDECTHALLDVTDLLRDKLNPIVNKFQTIDIGYFTVKRLIFLNNTVNDLTPNVSDIHAHQFDLTPFIEKISNLSKNSTMQQREVKTLLQDALVASEKAELTYKDAIRVQNLINKVIETSKATAYEINNLAFTLETGTGPQTDYALTEGKKILDDIRKSKIDDKVKDDARTVLARGEKLAEKIKEMTNPLNEMIKQLDGLQADANTIENKLNDLDNYMSSVQNTVDKTMRLNDINSMAKLSDKLTGIENTAFEANSTLANSTALLSNVSAEFEISKKNYENLGPNITTLQDKKMKVEQMIDSQADEFYRVKNLIAEAKEHAEHLEYQADILDSLIKGSRGTSETAVQAATSYGNIVKAIEEALNASLEARRIAVNATEKSIGLPEISKHMYDNSSMLLEGARLALQSVRNNLPPGLHNAMREIDILAKVNGQIEKGFKDIDLILEGLRPLKTKRSVSGYNELLPPEKVSQSAMDTLNSVQDIITNLPDDLKRAEQLRLDRQDIAKYVPQGLGYVNRTEKQLPNLTETLNRLKNRSNEVRSKDLDIKSLLENLKQKIAETRDSVDKIKVGVNVTRGSIELRVPSNLNSLAVNSYISFYLKTNSTTGLVLFLGNEIGTNKKIRRIKSDDYVALVLDAGYLVLFVDFGAGDINEVKNNKFVADNRWYKVIIERIGKNIRLSVSQDLGDTHIDTMVTQRILDGPWSVLNLDRNYSRLFVGSVPSSFAVPVKAFYNPFNGCLEELTIGDALIGFWDFVKKSSIDGDANDSKVMSGSRERDAFVYKQTSSVYRLNGEGYVMLSSKGYNLQRRSNIVLDFKTDASNGLLFLAFKDNTFESLEIRQGYVLYQYNVGRNLVTLLSPDQYADDQWHQIEAVRDENRGKLIIDRVSQVDTDRSDVKVPGLSVPDYFFIGGYPSDHKLSNVTKIPFDGCINQIFISSTPVDLNKNANTRGLTAGCTDKFASFVSFEEGSRGYAKWTNATGMNNHFEITFKFKTKSSTGGLLVSGVDGKASFRLVLTSDGNLVFKSGGQEVSTSQIVFNDDQWHPIMAIHDNDGLKIIVDDFDTFSSKGVPIPMRLLFGTLYFGSVPADIDASAASENQFVGCIGGATFNGFVINFGILVDTPGATIGKCSGPPQKPYHPPVISPKTTSTESHFVPVTKFPEIIPTKPTTTATPSLPIGLCALPPIPANDPDITDQSGYRFGTSRNGGLVYEFDLLPNKRRYEFSLDIKTISEEGLIFYVVHRNSSDFVALYLHEGKISYTIYMGASNKAVTLTSSSVINNAEWHNVSFSVSQKQCKLSVDYSEEQKLNITNKLTLEPPYYLGAVESPGLIKINTFFQIIQTTFEGCIRNFKANNNVVGDATKNNGIIPCSSKVESGVFFTLPGGYIKAREKFVIGSNDFHIKLRIKPRNVSGLLVAVLGKKDYAILSMNNGTINFTIESGSGPISALYVPTSPYYFCDGNWHSIEALKTANVIIITVDKSQATPIYGRLGEKVDTEQSLYIGGHPSMMSKRRVFESSVPYVGCMQNIEINNSMETIIDSKNVSFSICPTI